MHVPAGAEVAAGAADGDGADIPAVAQALEQIPQLGIGIEGEGVLALRAVQGDAPNPVGDAPLEVLRLVIGEIASLHGRCSGFPDWGN